MRNFVVLVFIILFLLVSSHEQLCAQMKIDESFEGTQFPPDGWTVANIQGTSGIWARSSRTSNSGSGCAVAKYTGNLCNNFLITKRIIPSPGDSLVFYFRQTFWNMYRDTLNVYISNTDSLAIHMTTRLMHLREGSNYPMPFGYGRFALNLSAYAGQTIWIGFQHINFDGDNVRIDDVAVGTFTSNDVGVIANNFPSGTIGTCDYESIVPAATITNLGNVNLTVPFNITYTISGPISYSNTVSDTIYAGHTKKIYFDTILTINEPGVYNVKIFSSLQDDLNRSNDTLNSTFTLYNSNFGGGLAQNGNYYFSNSTICADNAVSQPKFCWKDSTGSKSLILGGSDVSGGLLRGNIDNGYFGLGNILPDGHKIKFCNVLYDSIFISTNGIIGFKKNNNLTLHGPSDLELVMSELIPAFMPLWTDFDFGNNNVSNRKISYKVTGNALIINYDKAPVKSGDSANYVSFQVSFEIGNSLIENSRILTQYNFQNTGESFLEKYYNNTMAAHLVGLKNIDGSHRLVYRHKDTANIVVAGPLFNASLAVEFGEDVQKLDNRCSELTLKVLLEAISPKRDSITVSIREANNPDSEIETRELFLDNNGVANSIFSLLNDRSNYYLVVKHRNSIETWSKDSGVVFNSYTLNYDFSSDINMAFGSNMKKINNQSYIYSGDVDQNGIVDAGDLSIIDNTLVNFILENPNADLNKDEIIDASDLSFADNNLYISAHVERP